MKKNIYNTPKIKVKPIDSEDILAGTQSITQKITGEEEVVDDGESEAGSKSTSMFGTDTDNHWE